jgi:MraZ protein
MFHGSEQAKIDEKGRLKIPARFRQKLMDDFGPNVFMTCIKPMQLTIYPLKVWEDRMNRFIGVPDSLAEKDRYLITANLRGSDKSVDEQGRLPLPPELRDLVSLNGEVVVMGLLNTLVVMNLEYAQGWVAQNAPDAQVFDRLREYGI